MTQLPLHGDNCELNYTLKSLFNILRVLGVPRCPRDV